MFMLTEISFSFINVRYIFSLSVLEVVLHLAVEMLELLLNLEIEGLQLTIVCVAAPFLLNVVRPCVIEVDAMKGTIVTSEWKESGNEVGIIEIGTLMITETTVITGTLIGEKWNVGVCLLLIEGHQVINNISKDT